MTKLEIITKLTDFAHSDEEEYRLLRSHLEVCYCEWFEAGMYSAILGVIRSEKEIFDNSDFLDYAKHASKY